MPTFAQNTELLKQFFLLLDAHRPTYNQQRVYERARALALAELFTFGKHTVTQQLVALGLNDADWSAWYRLFSEERFDAAASRSILLGETLQHVGPDELYVVAGDGTQTPRSSSKMEGAGWQRNPRTPPFKIGIHRAQRWFNGSWLLPAENGYSRALPLYWVPAFTEKSPRQVYGPRKEWEAAVDFLTWLRQEFVAAGRPDQPLLMVADGGYDTVPLWEHLPDGVILMVRSAKNRALYQLPGPPSGHGRPRKYGERAPNPQAIWRQRHGWRRMVLHVRGLDRHLQVKVEGPFIRRGAADRPLFLIVVRGKSHRRDGKMIRRQPLPFLVNAVQNADGEWELPLPLETLLFWMWQRWEIEVAHREMKTTFGLGNKQCSNPHAAVASVQWSAWVYGLLLLAGYRTQGLTGGAAVPTRWWRGSGRWSLPTLWRDFRAALWGSYDFWALWATTTGNWYEKEAFLRALTNAAYGAART